MHIHLMQGFSHCFLINVISPLYPLMRHYCTEFCADCDVQQCLMHFVPFLSLVNAARREFSRISNLTSELELRQAGVERLGVDLSASLLELRQKIQVARAQANSVSTHNSTYICLHGSLTCLWSVHCPQFLLFSV